HLSVALAMRPDLAEALYPRALAAYRLRRWDDAVADATRCLEKYAFQHTARFLRADANRRRGHDEKAVADYTALIGAYPSDARLYEARALCYAALKQPALAKADREKALKVGGTATTLNNQAWHLVTGPPGERDPARALTLIRDALAQQPENATFLNT